MSDVSYGLKRNDYKKIKGMNREQLSDYLARVWKRGYEAGVKAATHTEDSRGELPNPPAAPPLRSCV